MLSGDKLWGGAGSSFRRLVMALAMLAPLSGMAMESMEDAEMSATMGQEGIGVQMELRINSDQYGRALSLTNQGDRGLLAANAGDFTNCSSEMNLSSTGCRLALKFANRSEWLVFKNFYGRLVMPLIYVDSGYTPVSATPYADLTRFRGKNGAPLLDSPNNIPLVKFSFPKEIEVWNLTIGGISMEHDTTVPGYMNADSSSVGGIRISNSVPNMPATISLQGSIGIFGF